MGEYEFSVLYLSVVYLLISKRVFKVISVIKFYFLYIYPG